MDIFLLIWGIAIVIATILGLFLDKIKYPKKYFGGKLLAIFTIILGISLIIQALI